MNKLISILKTTFTEDFNKTKFKKNKKASSKTILGILLKTILVIFIVTSVLGYIGAYAYLLADKLAPMHLTYVMLSMFSIIAIMVVFMEGIYRSGAVLFESRDNDMLLSMPIKRSTILASRLIRLISFEYLWTLMVMIPAIGVYEYFEKTDIYFYISTIVFVIIMPIIPTIVSSIIGYFMKLISARFKKKNIIQIFLYLILSLGIFASSIYLQVYIQKILENAKSINDIILKIYYPLGLYVSTISEFSLVKVIGLGVGNIALVVTFIYIFSLGYYKTMSKLSENYSRSNYKLDSKKEGKSKGVTYALFRKELSRFASSPIYLFNTAFGAIMILLAGGYLVVKSPTTLVIDGEDLTFLLKSIPEAIMLFFAFTYGVSCTTASSISLEGKSFWVTRSLPVKETKIFISKILVNLLVLLPVSYIVIIATAIKFKFSMFDISMLFISSTIMALFISIVGLVINLTWPRLNFKSDAQIVKQSASVMITILVGLLPIGAIIASIKIFDVSNINKFVLIVTTIMAVITYVLWKVLNTYGVKKFRELS